MKKTFLTAFAALLVAIPAVQAQKVNKSGLLTKIEKSDADIADAKKNAKASTWINRGKALYEACLLYTSCATLQAASRHSSDESTPGSTTRK